MTKSRKRCLVLVVALLLSTGASFAPTAVAQGRMSPEQQKAQFEENFAALSAKLSLTDEQRPQVRTILEKEQERRLELLQSMRQGQGFGGGREGMRARMQEVDQETENALGAILADEQMKQYAAFKEENARQGGNRGGRRGGGTNPQAQN